MMTIEVIFHLTSLFILFLPETTGQQLNEMSEMKNFKIFLWKLCFIEIAFDVLPFSLWPAINNSHYSFKLESSILHRFATTDYFQEKNRGLIYFNSQE